MKNEMIATVLKEMRKHNAMTVKDVVLQLKQHALPVAEKTVYGWESGQSQPDADTLLVLCEIYNIEDILGTFGYKKTTPLNLTNCEKEIILKLRQHSEMLPAIKKLLDM